MGGLPTSRSNRMICSYSMELFNPQPPTVFINSAADTSSAFAFKFNIYKSLRTPVKMLIFSNLCYKLEYQHNKLCKVELEN